MPVDRAFQGEEPSGLDAAGEEPPVGRAGVEVLPGPAPGVDSPGVDDGGLPDDDGETGLDEVAVRCVCGARVRSAGAVVVAVTTGAT